MSRTPRVILAARGFAIFVAVTSTLFGVAALATKGAPFLPASFTPDPQHTALAMSVAWRGAALALCLWFAIARRRWSQVGLLVCFGAVADGGYFAYSLLQSTWPIEPGRVMGSLVASAIGFAAGALLLTSDAGNAPAASPSPAETRG